MGEVQKQKVLRKFVKMPFGIGELPKEYNIKVHGPYDPATYYGPKDTPLGQVKVKELPGWLARRGKSPIAIGRAMSRAHWRWAHKYWPRQGWCCRSHPVWDGCLSLFLLLELRQNGTPQELEAPLVKRRYRSC